MIKKGTVISFDINLNLGFIKPDDMGRDVFFHGSEILHERILKVDDRVTYDCLNTSRGRRAFNVVRIKEEPGGIT